MNINCKKKILCLIDALGPGGAERQITGLASMLNKRGYRVEVVYFEPKDFFVQQLQDNGVVVKRVNAFKSKFKLLSGIRREIKAFSPDVVISYLQSSSIMACILKLTGLKYKLIVSERNTNLSKSIKDTFRFNLFRVTDCVVPNSYSQQKFINDNFPFLKDKNQVIVNFVDTDQFTPADKQRGATIIVAATIWPSKNTLGFINALKILKDKGVQFHVKWFGKVPDQRRYIQECETLIKKLYLQEEIELLDKTQKIAEEYHKADYFCLPSLYEGTPNVICEAMASGLPIICSNVCDNGRYVEEGVNGFLFDPKSPENIAEVIEKMLMITHDQYYAFRIESRKKAVKNLSKKKFINTYLDLIR